ncbi:MAG: DNA-binding transcriptional regulator Fis [Ruminobacter sp.]|jgi:Fis family transcriptional regulator|uniref:Putative Fis-like DNA-binding protein n=1 Tax=Ruminobacter amylophilus TaxID=867 RepID=A0A662ZIV2_9GAMM|nr:DNA-binding transcriptional regulator Fis [Ruminobacter sp.]SFP58921.1 Fis family transcriptional regulator, factor for inversion stimulation protein [Ruminobacter amylophilus]
MLNINNKMNPQRTMTSEEVQAAPQKPLYESVLTSVNNFLNNPENADTTDLYEIVLSEVERPLLDRVMQFVHGNQTKAAKMMGINRGTLRKKLKKYSLS